MGGTEVYKRWMVDEENENEDEDGDEEVQSAKDDEEEEDYKGIQTAIDL